MLFLFHQHCAVSIQKVFRGYLVRRVYRPLINKKMKQRERLTGLLLGWKTRRILKHRKMRNLILQLKEMLGLTNDKSAPSDLAYNINMQIPMVKRKLLGEFSRFFATGKWTEQFLSAPRRSVSRPSPTRPSPPSKYSPLFTAEDTSKADAPQPVLFRPRNREDMPITGLHIDFSLIDDTGFDVPPKPVHNSFLKKNEQLRGKRRLKKAQLEAGNQDEGKRNKSAHSPQGGKRREQEEFRQEDDKQVQPFLKRRSRAVEAQRLAWTTRSRVDCWGPKKVLPKSASAKQLRLPSSPTRKVKTPKNSGKRSPSASPRVKPFGLATFDLSPMRKSKLTDCKPVDQLEKVFAEIERKHVFVSAYFERSDLHTKIPHFRPDSYFVTHYTEDIYPVSARQETLETLETHYNYLCSEADE